MILLCSSVVEVAADYCDWAYFTGTVQHHSTAAIRCMVVGIGAFFQWVPTLDTLIPIASIGTIEKSLCALKKKTIQKSVIKNKCSVVHNHFEKVCKFAKYAHVQ